MSSSIYSICMKTIQYLCLFYSINLSKQYLKSQTCAMQFILKLPTPTKCLCEAVNEGQSALQPIRSATLWSMDPINTPISSVWPEIQSINSLNFYSGEEEKKIWEMELTKETDYTKLINVLNWLSLNLNFLENVEYFPTKTFLHWKVQNKYFIF